MANTVDKVLKVAENEIGYLEKKTNSQLYDKTANAGSNNYTKYAYELDQIKNFFNGPKNGYAWCACFVSWCFVKAYGVDEARKMLYIPLNSLSAGCIGAVKYYKNAGRFFTSPKLGDQIFFKDSDGDPGHTGIVYKVASPYVYTIEGNTSGASGVVANGGGVCKKQYSLSSSYIYGYGRPKYDAAASTSTTSATTQKTTIQTTSSTKTTTSSSKVTNVKKFQAWLNTNYSAGLSVDGSYGSATKKAAIKAFQKYLNKTYGFKLTVDGSFGAQSKSASTKCNLSKGAKSNAVYILQGVLYGLGYDCNGFDGSFGNGCYNAVLKYQKAKGLSADGVVGSNTWKSLLG